MVQNPPDQVQNSASQHLSWQTPISKTNTQSIPPIWEEEKPVSNRLHPLIGSHSCHMFFF